MWKVWYLGALVKNESGLCWEESELEKGKRRGTVSRRFKEGVCRIYDVVWPNINTWMGRVMSRLE